MDVKELMVTNVAEGTSELSGNKYEIVTLKQIAGQSVTGAIKFKMEKGQPLMARRVANVGRISVGEVFDGAIVTVKTTPYKLRDSDRIVESYTVAAYEGESAITLVNESFERQGIKACALDSKGEPTVDFTVETLKVKGEPAAIIQE